MTDCKCVYCEHDWVKSECPTCIRAERDALRAFAQEVLQMLDNHIPEKTWLPLVEKHGLLERVDGDPFRTHADTPLLTGEQQT